VAPQPAGAWCISLSLGKEDKENVPIILGHTVVSMQLLLRTELPKGRKKYLWKVESIEEIQTFLTVILKLSQIFGRPILVAFHELSPLSLPRKVKKS
jgi:hypothetical protein